MGEVRGPRLRKGDGGERRTARRAQAARKDGSQGGRGFPRCAPSSTVGNLDGCQHSSLTFQREELRPGESWGEGVLIDTGANHYPALLLARLCDETL